MALHSNTINSKNLTNLIHHQDDRQLSAEWHFFPTSHGKSPLNVMGGTVKCLVPQTIIKATSLKSGYNSFKTFKTLK